MKFAEYQGKTDSQVKLEGAVKFLGNGQVVTERELRRMTRERYSEDEIAGYYGVSRMYLWRLRKELGVLKKRRRSDKGVERVGS